VNRADTLRQAIRAGLKHALPRRVFLVDGPPTGGAIALTFDDGPHPEHTARILSSLAAANVKATFFFRGDRALQYPDIVRRVKDEGHDIGNHSFSHSEPRETSAFALIEELTRTSALLEVLTGTKPNLFRPPKGALSPLKLLAIVATRHTIALWNRDPRDYLGDVEAANARMFALPLDPGDIVLLHDTHPVALSFLSKLIDTVRARGLAFTTLSPWAAAGEPNQTSSLEQQSSSVGAVSNWKNPLAVCTEFAAQLLADGLKLHSKGDANVNQ
jgi:peptidoglycan/xylan/chitin deacetylase (PgdA/CDA1 family)